MVVVLERWLIENDECAGKKRKSGVWSCDGPQKQAWARDCAEYNLRIKYVENSCCKIN